MPNFDYYLKHVCDEGLIEDPAAEDFNPHLATARHGTDETPVGVEVLVCACLSASLQVESKAERMRGRE
jgi:hypothetical protein